MTESNEKFEIWSSNLSKIFKGEKKKGDFRAVDKIDLRVEPGIHGFLGPNGAGKTTTINMIIGALSISEGEAKVQEHKAGSVAAKQLIGFLPQDPQFYGTMSGEEYLVYIGKLGGLSTGDARETGARNAEYFDIWDARERAVSKYSGGMRQKIGIAAALIHDPKILILDEPTANLDPIGRQNIIDKVKELSGRVSVFVSSHILAEIEEMCTKVTMINHGQIVVSDTIKNIKQHYIGNTFILHTNKNMEIWRDLQADTDMEKSWIDKESEDQAIKIVPKDVQTLQMKVPRIVINHQAILYYFKRPEVSLQDIFMTIMAKKTDGGIKNA